MKTKQDMMKQFSAEVAKYIAEGWVIAPDSSCVTDGVVRVKMERRGELQTLHILNTMELAYDTYVMERLNEKGQILDQQTYYYLWAWRRQDEDNHEIVTSVKELVKED